MSTEPICPCEDFEHPLTIHNQAGLTAVVYRAGDFLTFRRALLRPLPGEVDLTGWRANAQGDLLLQTLEWWAYIADVLLFYNERSINERLLRTATLDANVRALVAILGYRPRPGIAGLANIGVLLSGNRPVAIPAGFRVQSKPAPGKEPQTFETTQAYMLSAPDAVPAAPSGVLAGSARQLYLNGKVKSIQPGKQLLLAPAGTQANAIVIKVQKVNMLEDSSGRPFTEIVPVGSPTLPVADASGYQLLESKLSYGVWKYSALTVFGDWIDLEGVDRSIRANSAMLLTAPGTALTPVLLTIVETRETIWYTNGDSGLPPAAPAIPAAVPHTELVHHAGFNIDDWDNERNKVRILLGWEPAGTLRNAPVATYNGIPATLNAEPNARGDAQFRVGNSQTVLLEDADGNGALVTGSVLTSTSPQMQVASMGVPAPVLKTPLRVLENVIALTRGKSVDREVLGTGDAVAAQEFTLKKHPLTYLPAGDGYKSTLRVWVNGVEWQEAKSFYNQPPDANIFVTREDDEEKTHVTFGDWVNGAGLPTGAEVTATYRIESGADNVEPGGISIITKPVPGVRAIRQPVLAGGGADPDPREQVRKYAPKSVLTFGRAISADDYDAIAARAPGVVRVRSYFAWNAQEQRATVSLFVGDDTSAVTSARNALRLAADPNRQVSVLAATRVLVGLLLAIRVQPQRVLEDVVAEVRSALADPDAGLLGSRRTGIGESIYYSQLSDTCLRVPGVESITFALFVLDRPDPVAPFTLFGFNLGLPPRINASAHEFFSMAPESVGIYPEVISGV
jgi:hypothetical protein